MELPSLRAQRAKYLLSTIRYPLFLSSPTPRGPLLLFPPPSICIAGSIWARVGPASVAEVREVSLLASALSEIDEPKQPKQPSVKARKSSRRPRLSPALKTKAKRCPGKGTAGLGSNLQLSVIDILLAARRYSTLIPVKRT